MFNNILNKTDSGIIILFIILAVMIIPVYKLKIKNDSNLLNVIKGNTEALTGLKTLLHQNNLNCKDCKKEQMHRFDRLEIKSKVK